MKLDIRKQAIKDLKSIDSQYKVKIHEGVLNLKNFPNISNIKKLTNFELAYRLRIGDYRVLFDIENNDTIIVGRILHRKKSY